MPDNKDKTQSTENLIQPNSEGGTPFAAKDISSTQSFAAVTPIAPESKITDDETVIVKAAAIEAAAETAMPKKKKLSRKERKALEKREREENPQYQKQLDREKKIAERVRIKYQRYAFLTFMLALTVVILAMFINAAEGKNDYSGLLSVFSPKSTPVPQEVIKPTPVPTPVPTPIPTPEPKNTYEIFVEDLNWQDAMRRCERLGGHLVVINTLEEFEEVCALADSIGVRNVWVGCSRKNGELVWVTGETDTGVYYKWYPGEPTEIDRSTYAHEDWLLLWKRDGEWSYNDMVYDPAHDYAGRYSGNIAFICEYEAKR